MGRRINNSSVHFRKLLPQVQKNLNAFRNLKKKGQEPDLVPVHEDQVEAAHTANSANFDFFVLSLLFCFAVSYFFIIVFLYFWIFCI